MEKAKSVLYNIMMNRLAEFINKKYKLLQFRPKKWAIYVNDLELASKVLEKLRKEGYKATGIVPENFIYWGAYIPEKDIMVSHLCLEMHYPEYEENLIYGDKYLNDY